MRLQRAPVAGPAISRAVVIALASGWAAVIGVAAALAAVGLAQSRMPPPQCGPGTPWQLWYLPDALVVLLAAVASHLTLGFALRNALRKARAAPAAGSRLPGGSPSAWVPILRLFFAGLALAALLAALYVLADSSTTGNACAESAGSALGNAIIEADADYTTDGGSFGISPAGLTAELSAGETSFAYVDGSRLVDAGNVVVVSATMCGQHGNAALVSGMGTAGLDCQAVVMDGWAAALDACYYVLVVKAPHVWSATLLTPLTVLGATVNQDGVYYAANAGMTGGCRLTTDVIHAHEWRSNGFPRPT